MSYYLSKLESIKILKELYVFREELLCDLAKNRTHELDTAKIEASQNINFYLEIVERQIKNEAIKRNYLTKIESLEASIVEKDRLLFVAEVKDLLLKDIKDKNMNCIDILRGEDLNSIRYVKMLEYRVDSLQNHLYDLKRF